MSWGRPVPRFASPQLALPHSVLGSFGPTRLGSPGVVDSSTLSLLSPPLPCSARLGSAPALSGSPGVVLSFAMSRTAAGRRRRRSACSRRSRWPHKVPLTGSELERTAAAAPAASGRWPGGGRCAALASGRRRARDARCRPPAAGVWGSGPLLWTTATPPRQPQSGALNGPRPVAGRLQ